MEGIKFTMYIFHNLDISSLQYTYNKIVSREIKRFVKRVATDFKNNRQ